MTLRSKTPHSGACRISVPRTAGGFASFVEMTNGNKCDLSDELGSAADDKNAKRFVKEETVRKIKSIAGHVGLLITLMLYTVIGGLVSRQRVDCPCKSKNEQETSTSKETVVNRLRRIENRILEMHEAWVTFSQ